MGCLSLPLLQRFPAQHMESRAQRFRLLRQGRQAPRASLQNSSPPQSSSSVQTPDCYNSIKEKAVCHWTIKILLVKLTWMHLLLWRTELTFTHGNYLQGVCGLVSHATGGRGARTRTDSVGAFATKNPGQVFDGVWVHQDCPRVNVPKVSKEREIHSQEATHRRYLHDSPCKLCCVDNTQKKKSFLFGNKRDLSDEVQSGLESLNPKVSREFRARCFRSLTPSPGMISLYMWTCLSSRPSLCTTKAEGWNFKESPTVRKWPSILPAQDCVSQCLCNDNDLQSLSECPSLKWRTLEITPKVRTYWTHFV